jgi:hypothetical protein
MLAPWSTVDTFILYSKEQTGVGQPAWIFVQWSQSVVIFYCRFALESFKNFSSKNLFQKDLSLSSLFSERLWFWFPKLLNSSEELTFHELQIIPFVDIYDMWVVLCLSLTFLVCSSALRFVLLRRLSVVRKRYEKGVVQFFSFDKIHASFTWRQRPSGKKYLIDIHVEEVGKRLYPVCS